MSMAVKRVKLRRPRRADIRRPVAVRLEAVEGVPCPACAADRAICWNADGSTELVCPECCSWADLPEGADLCGRCRCPLERWMGCGCEAELFCPECEVYAGD